jgi:hypothetical protein
MDVRDLRQQARIARGEGRIADAVALELDAAEASAAAGDRVGHALSLRHAADLLSESGDAAGAAPLYAQVLACQEAPALDAANALRGAALNAERLGRRVEARQLWSQARDRYAELDIGPGVEEAEMALTRLTSASI